MASAWCWMELLLLLTAAPHGEGGGGQKLERRASGLVPASTRMFHFVYELRTAEEARSYCRHHYSDLVSVHTMKDAHTLLQLADRGILQTLPRNHDRAWIGLYDDVTAWTWSLSDPDYYSEGQSDYRNWAPEEPGNQGSSQFCVTMDPDGYMRDDQCDKQYTALCVDLTGATETLVRSNASFSWEEAQQYCRQNHTDLASVKSAAQNTQLQALVPFGLAWIGLHRPSWSWLDGSRSSFSYWKTLDLVEPNNIQAQEHCVAAHFGYSGMWEDWNCDFKKAFVCHSWPVKKYWIKLQLQMTSDPNNPLLMEQVQRQLGLYLLKTTEATASDLLILRWTTDGTVFHRDSV